jgi:hypothetical protein
LFFLTQVSIPHNRVGTSIILQNFTFVATVGICLCLVLFISRALSPSLRGDILPSDSSNLFRFNFGNVILISVTRIKYSSKIRIYENKQVETTFKTVTSRISKIDFSFSHLTSHFWQLPLSLYKNISAL